ncbi:hypothetical protein LINPERPRIM_LOCUS32726, partial [Linum perenne]
TFACLSTLAIHLPLRSSTHVVPVGRYIVATIGSGITWTSLEVFGVTIEGITLLNLAKDLIYTDTSTGRTIYPLVNRQGLCIMHVESNPVKRLRINDNFGWSRYGVKPPTHTMWSVCDMSNGFVLSDCGEESTCDRLKNMIEEKDKLMEEKNKLMEKNALLMEEVASLKLLWPLKML